MKIIEALKRLKLLQKKIEKNSENIKKYSSILSNELPRFESNKVQETEVEKLIQANNDIADEMLKLKKDMDYTNLKTVVNICGITDSIAGHLFRKRTLLDLQKQSYNSLTAEHANYRKQRSLEKDVKVIRLYSESQKQEKLAKLLEYQYGCDSTLEIVNATTDLLELV